MKITKLTLGVLFGVIAVLAVPIGSEILDKDTELNVLNAALPALSGLLGMLVPAVPLGPILVSSVGLLHTISMILTGAQEETEVSKELTKLDLSKLQTAIVDEVKKVDSQVVDQADRIISTLINEIKSIQTNSDMLETLEYMRRTTADKMHVVLDPSITGLQKSKTMELMQDPHSHFRDTIKYFVSKFIVPNIYLPVIGTTQLFYDQVLEKDAILAKENADGSTDSLHSKLFKTYMVLVKILTDAYVMPIAAQTIQFQGEVKDGKTSDANSTKKDTAQLIQDYLQDVKALIDKTKSALEKASREIRNDGSFSLNKGKTVDGLSFCKSIPRIFSISTSGCTEKESPYNLKDYDLDKCKPYSELMPSSSQLTIYRNTKDPERPFEYLKFEAPNGDVGKLGHESNDADLIEEQASTDDRCPSVFCPAYKKNGNGVCTDRVRADYGKVITGTRFRVNGGVLYIDIQQGTYVDIMTVDRSSVEWKTTPPCTRVEYLSKNRRKLELGDFELGDKEVLTGIQLKPGSAHDGQINVFIEGGEPGRWQGFPQGSSSKIDDENELVISGGDPEKTNPKNLIVKPPVENARYYVKLQPSSLEADFGRSCLPMFDKREVIVSPPAPVVGLGLYVEASEGSGGIIALKLISPDLSSMVNYEQIEQFVAQVKTLL